MKLKILLIYILIILWSTYNKLYLNKKPIDVVIKDFSIYTITGMFLLSSFDKLLVPFFTGNSTDTIRLIKKYPFVSKGILSFIVIVGGVIELYGSYGIIKGYLSNNKNLLDMGAYVLVVFTFLATILMYANTIVGFKYLPILSNMSTMGGLLSLTQR